MTLERARGAASDRLLDIDQTEIIFPWVFPHTYQDGITNPTQAHLRILSPIQKRTDEISSVEFCDLLRREWK
jgi:hypothetical protein